MKTYLLYPDREWMDVKPYFDEKSILQDLGLRILYMMSAREVILEGEEVKEIGKPDLFIEETMRKMMLVPLETEEEIVYRQEILRDCLRNPEFIVRLYDICCDVLKGWDDLGRKAKEKVGNRDPFSVLVTDIHLLQLFAKGLTRMKALLREYEEHIKAPGLIGFKARLEELFSDKTEADLKRIMEDISFYAERMEVDANSGQRLVIKSKLVMECSLGDGLKFEGFRLEEVASKERKMRGPNSPIGRMQDFLQSRTPDSVVVQKDTPMFDNADKLEFGIVRHVMNYCTAFMAHFQSFFDQLHIQAAFYRGAVNLADHMKRFGLNYCYPKVVSQGTLRFKELKEVVMAMEQRIDAVGNTCDMEEIMLLIVTGANQGGKSTFLRSIGIAQVMMQCGLMVAAERYESGIFPSLFTHFTRREDSAMNSGRLDEELGRMSQIVEHLGERSMVLLNESFATTTEKEGSVIAYDIIKALNEAGVKVLTVTHLLSFAQRMYDETAQGQGVEFFSAERLENGRRTFKMIQHAPELTSFGLDLYEKIVGAGKNCE